MKMGKVTDRYNKISVVPPSVNTEGYRITDKYILCMDSELVSENMYTIPLVDVELNGGFIHSGDFNIKPFTDLATTGVKQPMHKAYNDIFSYHLRVDCECNPKLIQIEVGCVIETDDRVNTCMLRTKRQSQLSIIKGHVEYDETHCYKPFKDILIDNLLRELNEELSIVNNKGILRKGNRVFNSDNCEITFQGVMRTRNNLSEMCHLILVYKVKPLVTKDNGYDFMDLTKYMSGEPSKHDVEIVNKSIIPSIPKSEFIGAIKEVIANGFINGTCIE